MADFAGVFGALAYLAGSVVCHQLPERSFVTAGVQWPVCARCAGIYLGVTVGFAAWWMLRRALSLRPGGRAWLTTLAVVAMPTAVSWVGGVLGLWDGTNGIRFALAAPLGLVVGVVAAAVTAKDLR